MARCFESDAMLRKMMYRAVLLENRSCFIHHEIVYTLVSEAPETVTELARATVEVPPSRAEYGPVGPSATGDYSDQSVFLSFVGLKWMPCAESVLAPLGMMWLTRR